MTSISSLSPLPPSTQLVPYPPPPPPPTTSSTPTAIPPLVYRIHHPSSQTRYSFATGFTSKNQTTILSFRAALSRFGLAHLHSQTNISSPFISVYDDWEHARRVAAVLAQRWQEDVCVVCVDTRYLARGPVFRAVDLLREAGTGTGTQEGGGCDSARGIAAAERGAEWLHRGEYLVMYRIPAQAVRDETVVCRVEKQGWRAVGVIGES